MQGQGQDVSWRVPYGSSQGEDGGRNLFVGFSEVVAVDVETTGFSAEVERIVSVAMVRADLSELRTAAASGGEVELGCESFYALVNPGRPIPLETTAVHGIRDADVRGEPTFAELAAGLEGFAGTRVLVAHNAAFDRRFLEAEFRRAGRPRALAGNPVRCTMRRFQADGAGYGRRRRPSGLDRVAEALGVRGREQSVHDALEDARIALEIACVYYLRDNGLSVPGGVRVGLVAV